MELKAYYQALNAQEKREFAKAVKTSDGYLRHLVEKRRKASPKLCKRIEVASDNKVTRQELRPDIYED